MMAKYSAAIIHPRSSILGLLFYLVLCVMAAAMFGVAKNQRLDHHRHRLGVRQLLADVDEIEIFEINAVNGNNSRAGYELAFNDVTHQLGDVGVENQNQRLAVIDMAFHRANQAFR